MTLKDRLLDLITHEELNPNQFYVKAGLGNGFLDKVGNKLKKPSIEKISKLFPHWNIDYLQTGEGEKYKKDFQNNDASHSRFNGSYFQQGRHINDLLSIAEIHKGYQEIIKRKDEQIDKLIAIIDKSK
jgi:hypothetical protein